MLLNHGGENLKMKPPIVHPEWPTVKFYNTNLPQSNHKYVCWQICCLWYMTMKMHPIIIPWSDRITKVTKPGKYSKRRRSNVAVIHVRIVFISSFLFHCLLLNHSFQTNPNKITNCFKLFFLLQLTTTLLLRRFFIFEQQHYLQRWIKEIQRQWQYCKWQRFKTKKSKCDWKQW